MLGNDRAILQFPGPFGGRVEIGQSLILLLIVIFALSGGNLVHGAIFAGLLLLTIFLHELGHAWGCWVQGVPVKRVMLHGGGGFCERGGPATDRQEELIVAMGPLVNIALWALASLGQWAMVRSLDTVPSTAFAQIYGYLSLFGLINLAFFIFNLIPVQPLDGGKLLHLMLRRLLPAKTAFQATGWIGLVMSIAWIPAAIYVYVTYGLILFFLPSIPGHYRMARGQLA